MSKQTLHCRFLGSCELTTCRSDRDARDDQLGVVAMTLLGHDLVEPEIMVQQALCVSEIGIIQTTLGTATPLVLFIITLHQPG